MVMIYEWNDR
jgi:hypothetical protein